MKALHVFTLASTAESFFDGQFKFISNAGHSLTVAASTEMSPEFRERNRVNYERVDIARRVDIATDIRSIIALRKLIRREKFDAVFGHTPKGAMVAMIAAAMSGIKCRIYYRHGLIYTSASGPRRLIFKTVERITALFATRIVNVSPSLSALAVKDHLNPDRKQCIIGAGTCGGIDTIGLYNPANLPAVEINASRARFGIDSANFVIGFCGRMCKDKGIIELVKAFNLFKAINPQTPAKLLLVGGMDERDILPANIKQTITSSPDIIFTGRQPRENLPALYSLMNVFVFPSYREGFGMSVIEASAMQVPILVSRSHGCVDSIRENVTGRYIGLNPESIATELTKLLRDPDTCHTLGVNGRKFVTQNFERTNMWPLILNLYN